MQNHIAARFERATATLGQCPRERLHRDVIGHDEARKAYLLTYDLHHCPRDRRRPVVNRLIDKMRRHPHRQIVERPKRRKIPLEIIPRNCHARQIKMAIGPRPPMAGDMFEHRVNTPGKQSIGHRPPKPCHCSGLLAIAPVAQKRMRSLFGHIDKRRTIGIHPTGSQLLGNNPIA